MSFRHFKTGLLSILGFFAIFGAVGAWVLILRDTGTMPPHPDVQVDVLLESRDLSGHFSIAVVRNRYRIYTRHFPEGRVDDHTPYSIGGLSEQFTAMTAMKLHDLGLLSFDQRIGPVLPDLPRTFHEIEIGSLLNHTSGIDSELEIFDAKRDPIDTPGHVARYAPANTDLMNRILEAVLKHHGLGPLPLFIERQLLSALEMDGTYYLPPKDQCSQGEWFVPTEDLLKWEEALSSNKLVRLRTMRRAFTPVSRDKNGVGFGFGWKIGNVGGLRMEQTPSVSQNAVITRFSQKLFAIIVLSDQPADRLDAARLSEEIAVIYLGREMPRHPRQTVSVR